MINVNNRDLSHLAETVSRLDQKDNLRNAVLLYAEFGLRVFPIRPQGESPMIDNWQTEATNQTDTVKLWWTQKPLANIGIATGKASGIFAIIIDHDVTNDGIHSIRDRFGDVVINSDELYEGLSKSGKKESCILFPYLKATQAKTINNILPGVSIIGESGFFIAPPSITQSNAGYQGNKWDNIASYLPNAEKWAYDIARMSSDKNNDYSSNENSD